MCVCVYLYAADPVWIIHGPRFFYSFITGEIRQRLVDRQSSQGEFGCGFHTQSGQVGGVARATTGTAAAGEEFPVVRRQGLLFVQPQRPQRCPLQ